jgi:hypothetical protein
VKKLIDKDALIEWLQQSKANYLNHRTELIGTDFIAGAKSAFRWIMADLKNVPTEKVHTKRILEERRRIRVSI